MVFSVVGWMLSLVRFGRVLLVMLGMFSEVRLLCDSSGLLGRYFIVRVCSVVSVWGRGSIGCL